MPSRRKLDRYPSEYSDLFQRALDEGSVSIRHATQKEASCFRQELYHYRTAVRLEGPKDRAEELLRVQISVEGVYAVLRRKPNAYIRRIREALK